MPFINEGHIVYIVLLLIGVLIFRGPGRLPEIGAGLGTAIREFRASVAEARSQALGSPAATTEAAPPAATQATSAPTGPSTPAEG